MSEPYNTVSLSILGKIYKVKCPQEKVAELRESAQYLEDKMRKLGQTTKMGIDQLAIITALNVSHELLLEKRQVTTYMEAMSRRIRDLQDKVDETLTSDTEQTA